MLFLENVSSVPSSHPALSPLCSLMPDLTNSITPYLQQQMYMGAQLPAQSAVQYLPASSGEIQGQSMVISFHRILVLIFFF